MKTIISLILLFSNVCFADVIQLKKVDVTYRKYFSGGVDPLVTQNGLSNRTLGDYISLDVNTDILTYVYWDTMVHGTTDAYLEPYHSGQFRSVGLQLRVGANLFDWMQVGYYHHSQHLLDTTSNFGPFPREDGLELKLNLFREKTRDNTY